MDSYIPKGSLTACLSRKGFCFLLMGEVIDGWLSKESDMSSES